MKGLGRIGGTNLLEFLAIRHQKNARLEKLYLVAEKSERIGK